MALENLNYTSDLLGLASAVAFARPVWRVARLYLARNELADAVQQEAKAESGNKADIAAVERRITELEIWARLRKPPGNPATQIEKVFAALDQKARWSTADSWWLKIGVALLVLSFLLKIFAAVAYFTGNN